MLLSTFIISVLMKQYINTKQHYEQIQQGLERELELQLVVELMQDSIRHAGFAPCVGLNQLTTIDGGLQSLSVDKAGTALHIRRMGDAFVLVEPMLNPMELLLPQAGSLDKIDRLLIADCFHAELLPIQRRQSNRLTLRHPLVYSYEPPIYVGEWIDETYVIQGHSTPQLYYKRDKVDALSEVVQGMAIRIKASLVEVVLRVGAGTRGFKTMVRTP